MNTGNEKASPILNELLWVAQFLIAVAFVWIGYAKLTSPISALSKIMPWTAQLPLPFVRGMALIDIAGGLGILLPGLTRLWPRLGVWAAAGCTALQICAILFHFSRGEQAATPTNFVFLALSAFVLWGRWKTAPITPR